MFCKSFQVPRFWWK